MTVATVPPTPTAPPMVPAAPSARFTPAPTASAKPAAGLTRVVDVERKRAAWRQRTGRDIAVLAEGAAGASSSGNTGGSTDTETRAEHSTQHTPVDTHALDGGGLRVGIVAAVLALVIGGAFVGWLAASGQVPQSAGSTLAALVAVVAGLGLAALLHRLDAALRTSEARAERLQTALESSLASGRREMADSVAAAVREAARLSEASLEVEQQERGASERQLASSLHATFADIRETTLRELEGRLERLRAEIVELRDADVRSTTTADQKVAGIGAQTQRLEGRLSNLADSLAALDRRTSGADGQAVARAREQDDKVAALQARLDAVRSETAGAVAKHVAEANAQRERAVAELEARVISRLDGKIGDVAATIAKATGAQQHAISALETRLSDRLGSEISRIGERLAAVGTEREREISGLKALLDGKVGEITARLTASDAARERAITAVQRELKEVLDGRVADIGARVTAGSAEMQKVTAGLKALLDGKVGELSARVAESDTSRAQAIAGLERRLEAARTESETSAAAVKAELQRSLDAKAADLAARLDADRTQRDQAIGGVRTQIEQALNHKVGELANRLSASDAARQQAITGLTAQISCAIDGKVAELAKRLASVEAAREQSIPGLSAQLTKDVSELSRRLAAGETAREQAISALAAQMTKALDGKVSELGQRLVASDTLRGQAIAALSAQLTKVLDERVSELGQRLSASEAARDEAMAALTAQVTGVLDGKVAELGQRLVSSDGAREQSVTAVKTQLQALVDGKVAELRSRMAASEAAREQAIAALKTGIDTALENRIGELSRHVATTDTAREKTIAASRVQLEKALEGKIGELGAKLASTDGALRSALQATAAGLEQRIAALGGEAQSLVRRVGELDAADQRLSTQSESFKKAIADLAARLDPIQAEVRVTATKLTEASTLAATAVKKLADPAALDAVLDPVRHQSFNRRLTPDHVKTLQANWLRRLSVAETSSSLAYMAHRIRELEARSHGRLATSIEDAMLRCLLVKAVKGTSVEVLEIGTLFGIGASILYDTAISANRRAHLTLIDPLQGYYDAASLDVQTRLAVTRTLVRRNMTLAGVQPSDVTLIERLSTDPEALTEASARRYDLLVIDGDHSFAGVATDFQLYARLVKIGGYIVFDDYNKPDWPDVQTFVDREMPRHEWCVPVGAEWTTSVFRVIAEPPRVVHIDAKATAGPE